MESLVSFAVVGSARSKIDFVLDVHTAYLRAWSLLVIASRLHIKSIVFKITNAELFLRVSRVTTNVPPNPETQDYNRGGSRLLAN